VKFGIGIDASLGLSFEQQRGLVREAAEAGYESAWTPSGPPTRDGFHVAAQWAMATNSGENGCLPVGIAVIPVPLWTVPSLTQQAGTLSALTGGRFILGLGTGGIYGADYQRTYGLPAWPVVRLMREYLTTLRSLFAGEVVSFDGQAVKLHRFQVTNRPLNVPLYLSALGPQMLRLAGELADGVSLSWTPPSVRVSYREQIARGADRAGRDPAAIRVTEYIRMCIDDDVEAARRSFVRALMVYALGRPGAPKTSAYRGHFARMGYDAALNRIEARRDEGASEDELLDMFPPELLRDVGYFGSAEGAPAALARLSQGLDLAIVRIVGARPGLEAAQAVLRACKPAAG
jgi:alkanesulfonate monooxygenase SsuD/methylene tetrahydromethanopterin reductase-like flavin-dependent oxidoreductase (luciferase family)